MSAKEAVLIDSPELELGENASMPEPNPSIDIGRMIQTQIESGQMSITLRLPAGVYTWNELVRLPPHTFLYVIGKGDHKYRGAKLSDDEDILVTIVMTKHSWMLGPEHHHYPNYVADYRLVLDDGAHAKFQSVRLVQNYVREASHPLYEPGIVVLSGLHSGITVRDSRIELTGSSFVNGTGFCEGAARFGHVRVLHAGPSSSPVTVVTCERGQGWTGRQISVGHSDLRIGPSVQLVPTTASATSGKINLLNDTEIGISDPLV